MFFSLINQLSTHHPAWTVWNDVSIRMGLAFLTTFVLTLFLGKHCIALLRAWKVGERVRTEEDQCALLGKLHQAKNQTPTMGGILILCVLLLALGLWMDWSQNVTWIFLGTTVLMGGIGAYDDVLKLRRKNKKGLSGKGKLLIQVGWALLLGLYLVMPSFHDLFPLESGKILSEATALYLPGWVQPIWYMPIIISLLFTVCVITGSSNAVNLTDGLDGLAAGTVGMASFAFAVIAFCAQDQELAAKFHLVYSTGEIAIYLMAVTGACLGFLWYNAHPAAVFMGDTGSLPLGAILGVSAVLLRREFLLALIGGVFVLEALSVLLQVTSYRFFGKRRLFLCAPLHHHCEYLGWPETRVVTRFWVIAFFCACVGLWTLTV